MPRLRANGIDIGYEVRGAGPPLLMLHGASSSGREDFGPQLPLFSKAFRCYVPDARGHASTRWDVRDGFSYASLVDDALAFADELGLATFHLLGFSMGAATAAAPSTVSPSLAPQPRARVRSTRSSSSSRPLAVLAASGGKSVRAAISTISSSGRSARMT